MEENIEGFIYDLSKPVKLVTTKNKYWQATLQGKKLTIEVGKVKAGHDQKEEDMHKDYSTPAQAQSSMVAKIHEKLVKGYYSAVPLKEIKKQTGLKRKTRSSTKINTTSGQYFEKGSESTMFEVNDKKVKVTRTGADGRQKVQTRDFNSNEQAVEFYQSEQEWLTSQGYKVNSSKFVYSFVSDTVTEKKTNFKAPKPLNGKSDNSLSIIALTDDAISRTSASKSNRSVTKSNRSAADDNDDFDDDSFLPSELGPSCSSPIKVLLAETWNDTYDPAGYYMSQKLDGVRCFWTGTRMFSREGNSFFPPKWFVKGWPKSQMDGQLFIGRDRFSETISAIKKKVPIDSQWEKVVYLVFDAPGLKKPFKTRVQLMQKIITQIDNPHLKCHRHRICNGYEDLMKQLQEVNKIKGEGLMLRQPSSPYQNRRSKNLLKVKTFYDDEAVILGYKPGEGRCAGMVGALKCRNTHGVQFQCGSGLNDALRRKPPKIGTKITYKYQQFNKDSGKPRFPIFLRIYQPL